ncbi:MAG TPA: hypothetical protein VKF80_09995, partial [Candidatus Eisenbacteria bacterium]|nr:hypothetical protein [Candidatus Eisenbacteria bacterium]
RLGVRHRSQPNRVSAAGRMSAEEEKVGRKSLRRRIVRRLDGGRFASHSSPGISPRIAERS